MSETGKVSLTPEWIDDVKRILESSKKYGAVDRVIAVATLDSLLTALEEAQQQITEEKKLRVVEHEVAGGYHRELVEAQQTIARQRKALEQISDSTGIGYESAYRRVIRIADEALGNKEGSDKA